MQLATGPSRAPDRAGPLALDVLALGHPGWVAVAVDVAFDTGATNVHVSVLQAVHTVPTAITPLSHREVGTQLGARKVGRQKFGIGSRNDSLSTSRPHRIQIVFLFVFGLSWLVCSLVAAARWVALAAFFRLWARGGIRLRSLGTLFRRRSVRGAPAGPDGSRPQNPAARSRAPWQTHLYALVCTRRQTRMRATGAACTSRHRTAPRTFGFPSHPDTPRRRETAMSQTVAVAVVATVQ